MTLSREFSRALRLYRYNTIQPKFPCFVLQCSQPITENLLEMGTLVHSVLARALVALIRHKGWRHDNGCGRLKKAETNTHFAWQTLTSPGIFNRPLAYQIVGWPSCVV